MKKTHELNEDKMNEIGYRTERDIETYTLPLVDGEDTRLVAFLIALPGSTSSYEFLPNIFIFWKLCYYSNILGEVLDEPLHIKYLREVAAQTFN